MFRAGTVALLLLLGWMTPVAHALDSRQVLAMTAPSTVQIQALDNIGSGIVINDTGLILTNFHVVAVGVEIKLRLQLKVAGKLAMSDLDGAIVTRIHPKYDLALVQAKLPPGAATIPAQVLPRGTPLIPETKCYVIGSDAKSPELAIAEGTVRSTARLLQGLEYAQVTVPI